MSVWTVGTLAVSAYGAYSAADAAEDAGQLQYESTQDANQAIDEKFQIGKGGLDPYSESGVPAIDRRSALLGLDGPEEQNRIRDELYSGPGFQYKRDKIIGDVNRGASASRQIHSGNRLAALTDRLQGLYASQESQHVSELGDAARIGLSGASAIAGVSQNAGSATSANIKEGGTSLANAELGKEGAYQSGVADIYGVARDKWGK